MKLTHDVEMARKSVWVAFLSEGSALMLVVNINLY